MTTKIHAIVDALGNPLAAAILDRLRSEASFTILCDVPPCKRPRARRRYRLDRDANRALHMICMVRIGSERRIRPYVARRTAEGSVDIL